jgi:hypothetical protein
VCHCTSPFYFAPLGKGAEIKHLSAVAPLPEEMRGWLADVAVEHLWYIRGRVDERPHHRVDFIFRCTLLNEVDAERATRPDDGQLVVAWLTLTGLAGGALLPDAVAVQKLVHRDGIPLGRERLAKTQRGLRHEDVR